MKKYVCCLLIYFVIVPLHAQWVQSSLDSLKVTALAINGSNLFAGTEVDGVFLSTNNGSSWTVVNNGLTNSHVSSLAISGTNIFAGTYGGGVFLSTNNGSIWTTVNNGLSNYDILSLTANGTKVFAGTTGSGIFLSTDNGAHWTSAYNGLTVDGIYCLVLSDTNLFAGTEALSTSSYSWGMVFRSTNNGASWVMVMEEYGAVQTLAVSGSNVFAGMSRGGLPRGGVALSTDNGASWNSVNTGLTEGRDIWALAVSDTSVFVGDGDGVVFYSANKGGNWLAVNSELTSAPVRALAVNGTNLFAGTQGDGVWRRPLSEMILTSANQLSIELPKYFNLSQNYPNPFNPSTTIRYALPSSSHVKITIHDILGREIATLVNEEQSAGWKEVQWNAAGFASGMYVVKMSAGNFIETKKILLMK